MRGVLQSTATFHWACRPGVAVLVCEAARTQLAVQGNGARHSETRRWVGSE